MQERVFLETDVHERGLEAVFEVADLALENAADEAFLGGAFDVEFLQLAVFDHRHARFERLGVDDDFLVDFFLRADEPLDLFDEVGRRDLDGVQNAFRRLLDGHRLKRFFLLHLGRRVEMRLAEFLFGRAGIRRFLFRRALRRQAGGDVFGAFDFVGVPFFKKRGPRRPVRSPRRRAPGWLRGRIFAGSGPGRPWGGNAFRGAAVKSFCCSYSVSSSMDVNVLHQTHGDQRAEH